MLRPNIIDISYARVSTKKQEDSGSLEKQCQKLKEYKDIEIIRNVSSGGNEFPEELKNRILGEKQKNNDVRLNVISFDRVTRNFIDLQFLYNNVKYIHVLEESRTYDVLNELSIIASKAADSVKFLENTRNNATRSNEYKRSDSPKDTNNNSPRNNTTKLSGRRRERDEETEEKHGEKNDLKKKCIYISENLCKSGVPKKTVTNLEKLIYTSQNLTDLKTWDEMFSLLRGTGVSLNDINGIKKNYEGYLKQYKNKKVDDIYRVKKGDVVGLVTPILNKRNYMLNDKCIGQFIDCNIKFSNFE
jgi:Resolvase, N terminal domain